jgi:hypothetical protein
MKTKMFLFSIWVFSLCNINCTLPNSENAAIPATSTNAGTPPPIIGSNTDLCFGTPALGIDNPAQQTPQPKTLKTTDKTTVNSSPQTNGNALSTELSPKARQDIAEMKRDREAFKKAMQAKAKKNTIIKKP